jgi:hypothetical protein
MIGSVGDSEGFLDQVPWFLSPGESAVAGRGEPWSRGPVAGLPALSHLLDSATVTPVSVGDRRYELLARGKPDRRRGWLCLPPVDSPIAGIHPAHREFLVVCGGIVERFGEPVSWWFNQDEVLTESAARMPLAPVLADYAWLWRDDGLEIPIEPDDYYVVAVEANGNLTLANRTSGELLMFAPDHAFDRVTPLPGCPRYSLMSLDTCLTWRRGSRVA